MGFFRTHWALLAEADDEATLAPAAPDEEMPTEPLQETPTAA
jgi:hypothetical protein